MPGEFLLVEQAQGRGDRIGEGQAAVAVQRRQTGVENRRDRRRLDAAAGNAALLGEMGARRQAGGDAESAYDLDDTPFGVVDEDGHLAAAVSTGGYTGKLPGRVGDSPIPGAGLYADDRLGAAVGTGTGELFIRLVLAKYAVEQMSSAGAAEAATRAIHLLDQRLEGKGGIITVDREGRAGAAFNTAWMPWGDRIDPRP